MTDLRKLQKEIHKIAQEKGWWKEEREFGTLIALIHSEVSEAMEAWRSEYGCVPETTFISTKPEGWAVELADAIIRILDVCAYYQVDLEPIINRKMAYNRTRPYRHGGKRA